LQNIHSPALQICEGVLGEAYASLDRTIEVEHLPGERSRLWAICGRLDGELCRGQLYHLLDQKHAALATQIDTVPAQMSCDGRIAMIQQEVMVGLILEAKQAPSTATGQ